MVIKKISSGFAFFTMLLLLAHVIYEASAFATMIVNLKVTAFFGKTTATVMMLHGIFAAIAYFGLHDSKTIQYKKLNIRTLIQRISSICLVVMLPLHVISVKLLIKYQGTPIVNGLLCFGVLFYAVVFTHVAMSFSNALITFGLLEDIEKKKKMDRVGYVICGLLFILVSVVITLAEYKMFRG